MEFVMNAISKSDRNVETDEEINEPIPAFELAISTKTDRFCTLIGRWTQSSYNAWEKAGRPYREL